MSRKDILSLLTKGVQEIDTPSIRLPTQQIETNKGILGPEYAQRGSTEAEQYIDVAKETTPGKRKGKTLEPTLEQAAEDDAVIYDLISKDPFMAGGQPPRQDIIDTVTTPSIETRTDIDKAVNKKLINEFASSAGLGRRGKSQLLDEAQADTGPGANIRDALLRDVAIRDRNITNLRNNVWMGIYDLGPGGGVKADSVVGAHINKALTKLSSTKVGDMSSDVVRILSEELLPSPSIRKAGGTNDGFNVGRTAFLAAVGRGINKKYKILPKETDPVLKKSQEIELGAALTYRLAEMDTGFGPLIESDLSQEAKLAFRTRNELAGKPDLSKVEKERLANAEQFIKDGNQQDMYKVRINPHPSNREMFTTNSTISRIPNLLPKDINQQAKDATKGIIHGANGDNPQVREFMKDPGATIAGKAANAMGTTEFRVNHDAVGLLREFDAAGIVVPPTQVNPKFVKNIQDRVNAARAEGDFDKVAELSAELRDEQQAVRSRRDNYEEALALSESPVFNNTPFSYDVFFDARGRIYYDSIGFHPQAAQTERVFLEFGQELPYTKAAADDIKEEVISYIPELRHLDSSLSGKGKDLPPAEQRKLFDAHRDTLMGYADDPAGTAPRWLDVLFEEKEALQPILALRAMQKGEKLGVHNHPIWRDRNGSGFGVVAGTLKDKNIAKYVDMDFDQADVDAYTSIATGVAKRLEAEVAAGGEQGVSSQQILDALYAKPKILRNSAKKPAFIWIYNGGDGVLRDEVMNAFADAAETNPITKQQASHFLKLLKQELASSDFQQLSKWKDFLKHLSETNIKKADTPYVTEDGRTFDRYVRTRPYTGWKSESGFPFDQKYQSRKTGTARLSYPVPGKDGVEAKQTSFVFKAKYDDTDDVRRDRVNKETTSFSPNVTHSMDADELHHILSYVSDKGIPLAAKHDSIAVPAGAGKEFREAVEYSLGKVYYKGTLEKRLEQSFSKAEITEAKKLAIAETQLKQQGVSPISQTRIKEVADELTAADVQNFYGDLDVEEVLKTQLDDYDTDGRFPYKPGD